MSSQQGYAQNQFPGRYAYSPDQFANLTLWSVGIPACRAHNFRGSGTHYESGHADAIQDRISSLVRWSDFCPAVSPPAWEAREGGYYATHSSHDRRRAQRYARNFLVVYEEYESDVLNVDHDERIPLFMRSTETDPELPYAPLLR